MKYIKVNEEKYYLTRSGERFIKYINLHEDYQPSFIEKIQFFINKLIV